MRAVALLGLVLLAGCAWLSPGPSAEQRAEYDARIARELEEAVVRRDRQLRVNREVLDALEPFPGAERVSEEHQGNEESGLDVSDEELDYQVYASEVIRPYLRYELLTADSWSSYRRYQLPAGTATRDVYRSYAKQLRGWAHLARERGRHRSGHPIFADDFWRDDRCVWIHVGLTESQVEPPRSLTVATSATPRDDCV